MASYRCFDCEEEVDESNIRTKVRCPYCGSKILYKERTTVTNVKAR